MMFLLSAMARAARNRPGWVLLVLAAITIVLGGFSANQSTDTELSSFAPDSELNDAFTRVEEEFVGGGESVQIIVDAGADGTITDAEGVRLAAQIAEAARTSGAELAEAPDGSPVVTSYADGALEALAAEDTSPGDASDEQVDAAAMTTFESDAARLLSVDADAETATARGGLVLVQLDPELSETGEQDSSLLVADAIADVDTGDLEVSTFNQYVLDDMLQADSESEMNTLLGISLLLIVGIMVFLFRTISDVLMGLGGLLVSIIWMMGLAVILGPDFLGITGPFTQVAMIVPILLVGLGIDYSIHLTTRYREERGHGLDGGSAAAMAIRTVGGALVLATLTTVVGFLTNLFSPLPPIGDFGLFTAAGVISAFVVMALMVPSLRKILDDRRERKGKAPAGMRSTSSGPSALSAVVGKASVLAKRAPKATLAVAAVISVAAAGSATQIDTSFSQDDFVPDDSEAGEIIDSLDHLFGGDLDEVTYVVMDGDLTDPAAAEALTSVQEAAADIDDVRRTDGVANVSTPITLLHELAAADPQFADAAAQLGLQPDGGFAPDADIGALYELAHEVAPERSAQLVDAGGRSGLIEFPSTAGQDRAVQLRDAIEAELAPVQAAGVTTMITSEPLVLDDTLDALTASQSRGIVITLAAAMLLLSAFFAISDRRPLLGVITMIPSIAVVAWVLGVMPLLGINFNVLTAMVASLGIGIGVPYGIHVTHRFLEDRRRAETVDDAVEATVTHTGGAMAGSAATTAAGFGVLVFSSLEPMRQFGGIIAITILFSLLAAVAIQPACLKLWADHRARRGDTGELLDHELRELLDQETRVGATSGDDSAS